ncbi:MAG: anti-sigma factor antagonist [Thermodesulfovibrio sp.]|nr:anti-sigma factor antagonist [Thermodesulfovibrio sp.]
MTKILSWTLTIIRGIQMKMEKQPDNTGKLVLTGDLTIQHVTELRGVLLQAMQEVEQLTLDMSGVTDIDVPCLQLLCSAHRTFHGSGKKIEIQEGGPEVLKKTMNAAGYSSHVCGAGEALSCLWKGGKG